MTFAIFQVFEFFRLFDDFSTDLPPPPSISSYLTVIRVALVDESIDELVLSIKEVAPSRSC